MVARQWRPRYRGAEALEMSSLDSGDIRVWCRVGTRQGSFDVDAEAIRRASGCENDVLSLLDDGVRMAWLNAGGADREPAPFRIGTRNPKRWQPEKHARYLGAHA
jgi:hypothetical protein